MSNLENTGKTFSLDASFSPEHATGIFDRKKPEVFVNEELPATYKNRLFIQNVGALGYDIFLIPGNIVRYDSNAKSFELKTLKGILKNGEVPEIQTIDDGILYSAKINSSASFNASNLIANLSVENNKIMELVIQDMAKSIVEDNMIDEAAIKAIADKIDENDRKNYFYVKTTLLTVINNRKFSETKFDANINLTYVTAGGKIYGSNEKFVRERMISVDLISLNNLIIS